MTWFDRIKDAVPYRERPTGEDTRVERQELWCHDCQTYVQFDVDVSLNGNHVLECSNCGHEHCRVVRDGEISDIRWDQRNGATWLVSSSTATSTANSTYVTSSSTDIFLYGAWLNAGTRS